MTLLQKARAELKIFERCSKSTCEEMIARIEVSAEQERLRFEGDLDKWMKELGAGITGNQPEAYSIMDLAVNELVRLRARAQVTDEMVERAAKALEKKVMQDTYEWTDDEFEIWWNKDVRFTEHIRTWGWFQGSEKAKRLYETRIALEAALISI
jgi:hypothetical protein